MFILHHYVLCAQLLNLSLCGRTVAYQASLAMKFSRQEYWNSLPFRIPGDLPDPGIEPESPALAGRFFTSEPPGKNSLKGRMVYTWWDLFWQNTQNRFLPKGDFDKFLSVYDI